MNPTPSLPTRDDKVFVAGHRGMIGAALVRALETRGYTDILVRNDIQLDILDQRSVFELIEFQRPSYVFCAAERLPSCDGEEPGRVLFENLTIQNNLIHGAHEAAVRWLAFIAADGIYPAGAVEPVAESAAMSGPPATGAYGQAKLTGVLLCDAYRAQYGQPFVSIVPSCVYGPADSFDLHGGRPVPVLLRQLHLAKLVRGSALDAIPADEKRHGRIPDDVLARLGLARGEGKRFVATGAEPAIVLPWAADSCWDLVFADDLATVCVDLMERGYDGAMLNVGSAVQVTLAELAARLAELLGFDGKIEFAPDGPAGSPRLDTGRLSTLGLAADTRLEAGLAATYADYTAERKKKAATVAA
ncbi:MAG: NAD-dependent epimerase/dehydratase family protein [Proteobacteria bacterium]|nr:NAD-dependent epimerase/dehydratase family protein [Pseudomonadota bacterium]